MPNTTKPDKTDDPRGLYLTLAYIGFAFINAQLLYAVVIAFINFGGRVPAEDPPESVGFYFLALAALFGYSAIVNAFRRRLISKPPAADPHRAAMKFRTIFLITIALCEFVSLVGISLFFVTGWFVQALFLIGWATGLLIVYFPRYRPFEEYLMLSRLAQ